MAHRRLITVLATVSLFALAAPALFAGVNPVLNNAVSRRAHGGALYDIPLPLTGSSGIECRKANGTDTIVLFFDQPINGGTAVATPGAASTGSVSGSPAISGSVMTVNLTGLSDVQELTLTLSNVTTTGGGNLPSASVKIRFIEGDTNGNGLVSAGDTGQIKSQVGQPVSGFNFRTDINQNGSITAADVNIAKAKVGKTVPGNSAMNFPPTVSNIADQVTNTGTVTVSIAVGDPDMDANSVAIKASSDNLTLLPQSTSYAFSGSGATRALTITSALNQVGTATVTVTVGDGLLTTSDTFLLTVNATPTLYIASLYPTTGVQTQGWGSASLKLDGDETAATVNVDSSNLNSTTSTIEVRNGAASLVNLKTLTSQPDGSYRWVFPAQSAASTASAIRNNQTSLVITTATNAGGEIQGPLNFATGSQTFVPPAAVAQVTTGPNNPQEAARFLRQATFGPYTEAIADLQKVGYQTWLDAQFDPNQTPPTLIWPVIYERCTNSSAAADALVTDRVVEAWWRNSIVAPDQLRQRVATAYSEIFVISAVDDNLSERTPGIAAYHDLLINSAFGNFRTLLKNITLTPAMGQYLNMRGNLKPSSPSFQAPNENYAREIMQLFSVGLNLLNPDGTLILDVQGNPIPTYDQSSIQGFAHVFTGWNTDSTPIVIPTLTTTGVVNVSDFYTKPMVVNAANHSTNSKLLLSGTVLPATSTQTTTTANAELDKALDNIFNHANVGPFMARELIQRLVCSNPSPAYIYRVAQAFNNDGAGVRGNMKAVIKAILLDPEARDSTWINNPGYGHLREPLLRCTNLVRAFHPTSVTGYHKISRTDTELQQSPYRAPTVFNFFEPAYAPPGILTDNGIVGPEFQITSETTVITAINFIYNGIYTAAGWKGSDVRNNFATEQAIAAKPTTGSSDLLDHLNLLLMSGQMPQPMKDRIVTYINTVSAGDYSARVKAAIYLVATSPQCAAER
jgi:uncharacterized protein (DUF1800 family)